jgi:SOS response regulatory protein OraA/RecX
MTAGAAATRAGVPARITGLEPDPRRPGSVRVIADGCIYCTLGDADVKALGLAPGLAVDGTLAERLTAAADAEAAYRTVLRALERRAYARNDLARRLVRRAHPREAVEAALDRAAAVGLLDDAKFALHYVQTRAARGRGPFRVLRDLLALGVERSLIERAIAEEWPADADRSAAPRALAAQRARQLGDLPRPVKRRRLLAFLARRGYTGSEAIDAVREAVG